MPISHGAIIFDGSTDHLECSTTHELAPPTPQAHLSGTELRRNLRGETGWWLTIYAPQPRTNGIYRCISPKITGTYYDMYKIFICIGGCIYIVFHVYIYIHNVIDVPTDWKPRKRFEGLVYWTIRILCNLQDKMLFRNLVTSQFWIKNGVSKSIGLWPNPVNTTCIRSGFEYFFHTHRRLSDPSTWKPSSTASCQCGTHSAIASKAGTAWHLCYALLLSANC